MTLAVPFLTDPATAARAASEVRSLAEVLANRGELIAPLLAVLAGALAEYAVDLDVAYGSEAARWADTLPDSPELWEV